MAKRKAEYSQNSRRCLRRLVPTLVPVMSVWCVWCVSCCVCGVGGAIEGWEKEGVGGIDTNGWVLGPMCCDVPPPWLPGIHGETHGPNNREIVVGAFVAWCPPYYL